MRRPPELEFLPAALEVERSPPVPAARVLLWCLVLCAGCALAWSVWGRVDVVGVAPGRVVAAGRSKLVQPLETAVVARLAVREGQHVRRGEVLVELDVTTARASHARLTHECVTQTLERRRLARLLAADGPRDDFDAGPLPPGGWPPALLARAAERYGVARDEYHAALDGLTATAQEKRAARAALAARIAQLARTLPLISEAADAHRQLLASGIVPRVRWLEQERARIDVEQELAARRDEHRALGAALAALAGQRAATLAQFRGRWLAERAEANERLARCREALVAVARSLELAELKAPIDGIVQQLAVHTVGGVVTPAQTLMLIAPAAAPLEVEAQVANRDIGFVHVGMRAEVKIETFDYTRYGVVAATVRSLSRDAVADGEREPYFLAQLELAQTALTVDGRERPMEPGMLATVELRLGRRRVIEFLLSPLLRYRNESARER